MRPRSAICSYHLLPRGSVTAWLQWGGASRIHAPAAGLDVLPPRGYAKQSACRPWLAGRCAKGSAVPSRRAEGGPGRAQTALLQACTGSAAGGDEPNADAGHAILTRMDDAARLRGPGAGAHAASAICRAFATASCWPEFPAGISSASFGRRSSTSAIGSRCANAIRMSETCRPRRARSRQTCAGPRAAMACENAWGDGRAAERFADSLRLPGASLLQKVTRMTAVGKPFPHCPCRCRRAGGYVAMPTCARRVARCRSDRYAGAGGELMPACRRASAPALDETAASRAS